MSEIFGFDDYRAYLRSLIESKGSKWGLQAKLSKAAGCQASYLSQVLRERAHLTADHVLGLGLFLKLADDEIEFFLKLVEKEKAATPVLKKFLKRQLDETRKHRDDFKHRFKAETVSSVEEQACYYSSWHWMAIHILIGIEGFGSVEAIAKKLSLDRPFVRASLERLEQMGFAVQVDGKWTNTRKNIHLPKESYMTAMNHSNWRQKAIIDSQQRTPGSLHYTALQSISRSDLERFKGIFLDAVEKSRSLVIESGVEEMVCLNCDVFVV
jgi:uncharacterized protein (TIGR02147 family)